jgi:hypothetical protein
MKKLIVHLIVFASGCAITAGLFSQFSCNHTMVDQANLGFKSQTINSPFPDKKESAYKPDSSLINAQAAEIQQLLKQIELLQSQLKSQQTQKNNSLANNQAQQPQAETELRTMNMQTFEESMKTQFTNQFKGVVLQLEGQRLEDIKQGYASSNEKNEWSNQYENSIAEFLATQDMNGDHYLQSLDCNTNVCRLEVNTNDTNSWNRLYAKMTNQTWYKSITVQEKSEYPGNVIYYLPSLNN